MNQRTYIFAAITYTYFHCQNLSKVIRISLFVVILIYFACFAFHKFSGFFNVIAINELRLSKLSARFSMYLNFDKVMAALIMYATGNLVYKQASNTSLSNKFKYTLFSLVCCTIIVAVSSLISGYILFEPKLPNILPIWSINNFLFVCFSEEVFFRWFLQRTLQNSLPKQQILAVIITSLIFGLEHLPGGILYLVLSTLSGFFYGYVYYKTNEILYPVIVHFGLNLAHLLLFTYPALKGL